MGFSQFCFRVLTCVKNSVPALEFLENVIEMHNAGTRGNILDLAARLDIAIDVAHAITYLHMYTGNCLVEA